MEDNNVADEILRALASKGAMKAVDLARHLSGVLGREVTRTEVNRALYYFPALSGMVRCDANHRWELTATPPAAPAAPKVAVAEPNAAKSAPAVASHVVSGVGAAPAQETAGFRPTPQQERLIAFEASGNLLIRGEAGAGKTTVLVARARRIHDAELIKPKMLFLTYNGALAAYVKQLAQANGLNRDLRVNTMHEWAGHFVRSLDGSGPGERIGKPLREVFLENIVKGMNPKWGKNHLSSRGPGFWSDEVEWIHGQALVERAEYVDCARTGRGTAVQVRGDDREFVWDVFERYRRELEQSHRWDQDDPAGLVLREVQRAGGNFPAAQRVDHLFIDEVQDFQLSWLLAVAPIPRLSMTLAGDLAQRIYRRHFTWKAAGIDLPAARSQKLVGSHRTTDEIMRVAIYVATNKDLSSNEDFTAPTLPGRSGPKVVLIERKKFPDAQDEAAKRAAALANAHPGERVLLAVQFTKTGEMMQRLVERFGARAAVARGEAVMAARRGVTIATYHQVKGLEFDHVVLSGLEAASMPEFWLRFPSAETREENEQFLRRLVYVAMTRARISLTLTGGAPFCPFFKGVPAEFFERR